MKYQLLLLLPFLLLTANAKGQATATDFTATDCSGYSHTLFNELNAGHIIVLVWIEPCGGCISDAKDGYRAAASFASAYPGKVLYWLSDDQGNTDCTTLYNWETANGLVPLNFTTFDNTGNIIDENNYGGLGMPHVVVLGGTGHYLYYNKLSGFNDSADIATSINNAINGTNPLHTMQLGASDSKLGVFPNPARDKIFVTYSLGSASTVVLGVYDILGNRVQSIAPAQQSAGIYAIDVNFNSTLPDGMYFLRLNANGNAQTVKFMIVN